MNAGLHRIFAEKMAQKLELIKMRPQAVLQYGADGGASHEVLAQHYPDARLDVVDARAHILSAEPAAGVWQKWAKKRTLFHRAWDAPLPPDTYDLLWANMAFPLTGGADGKIFSVWQSCLKSEGMLFFNTLGTMTLQELEIVPDNAREMLALGDALTAAGFAGAVTDTENIYLTYRTDEAFWRDMQALGLDSALAHRAGEIAGKIRSGSLKRITLEIVYGHAVKDFRLPEGESAIRFYPKKRH